jgi:biotin carboxylase
MQLGANAFQTTLVKVAKELGYHVITVDYLPDNPGHKYSDEYHNVSTIDKNAVLALAEKLSIDGICAYASDVSACTAAYVAEKLGLPTNPFLSVETMVHKDLTREFMERHGFNAPRSKCFTVQGEAREYFQFLNKSVIVKPTDNAGSKGVSRVDDFVYFDAAFNTAMEYSFKKKVIVEEFIVRSGYQIAGDSFLCDGEIVFSGFMDGHFDKDCNPFVPFGESYPSSRDETSLNHAKDEIQRYLSLLDMKTGAINMDFIFDDKGDVYIIELGPRSGGNWISDIIYEASGINIAMKVAQAAVGDKVTFEKKSRAKNIANYIIHSQKDGILDSVCYQDEFRRSLLKSAMFAEKGDEVRKFDNAGMGIGAILFESRSIEEMNYRLDNMGRFLKVVLQ